MDAFVAARRKTPEAGVAVAIVRGGRLEFFKGYGFADRDRRSPVTSKTLFAIGSATKSFTSLAASMLEDEGILDLEAPIAPQLPGFSLSDANVSARIAPVDMLSHRSGLPRHDFLWYLAPFERAELFSRIPFLAMNRKPGMGFREGFQYNNLMYLAVGRLIERASGETWERFVEKRILQPLEMGSTTPFLTTALSAEDVASPYAAALKLEHRNLERVGPAGSIYSNVDDLLKWTAFHLRGGALPDGRRLLSERAHGKLFDKLVDLPDLESTGYGLGWFLTKIGERTVAWHAGNIDGFSSFVSFCQEADASVIVLTNENGALLFQLPVGVPDGKGGRLALLPRVIYDRLFGVEELPPAPASRRLETVAADPRNHAASHDLSGASPAPPSVHRATTAERFSDPGYGEISVEREGDAWFLRYYGNRWPIDRDREGPGFAFSMEGLEAKLVVRGSFTIADGQLASVRLPFEDNVDPIEFRRIVP